MSLQDCGSFLFLGLEAPFCSAVSEVQHRHSSSFVGIILPILTLAVGKPLIFGVVFVNLFDIVCNDDVRAMHFLRVSERYKIHIIHSLVLSPRLADRSARSFLGLEAPKMKGKQL